MHHHGRRRFHRRAIALLAVAALALATVTIASAQSGQPGGITDEAREMHDLYLFVLITAAIVFLAVEGALVFAIIKFRKRNDELPPQTHGSNLIEFAWTGIPVLIVVALFTYSVVTLQGVEEDAQPDYLTVDVTGFQFQWQFVYTLDDLGTTTDPNAEGQVTIIGTGLDEPTLVIPVDEPVEFVLHSNDVIHSFYIPDFLYKLDVIPGRTNSFVVTPRETGTFDGQCAELCGVDHALMRFDLRVVERDEFDQWIAEQSGGGQAAARAQ